MQIVKKLMLTAVTVSAAVTANADAQNSEYQMGYEQGFRDGKNAGGGGTHDIKPGDIIFSPPKTGGWGSSDRVSDPFVMIFDGRSWSSLTIDPQKYLNNGGLPFQQNQLMVPILNGKGMFSPVDGTADAAAALQAFEANTGISADALTGALYDGDLGQIARDLANIGDLNLPLD